MEEAEEAIDFSKVEIEPLFQDFVRLRYLQQVLTPRRQGQGMQRCAEEQEAPQFVLDDGTGEDRIILSGIHAYYEPEELVGKTLIAITNLPPRKMMGIDSCGMLLGHPSGRGRRKAPHLLMVGSSYPGRCKAVLIKNIRQSKLPRVKVPSGQGVVTRTKRQEGDESVIAIPVSRYGSCIPLLQKASSCSK